MKALFPSMPKHEDIVRQAIATITNEVEAEGTLFVQAYYHMGALTLGQSRRMYMRVELKEAVEFLHQVGSQLCLKPWPAVVRFDGQSTIHLLLFERYQDIFVFLEEESKKQSGAGQEEQQE